MCPRRWRSAIETRGDRKLPRSRATQADLASRATPPRRRQVKADAEHSSAGCAAPTLRFGACRRCFASRRGDCVSAAWQLASISFWRPSRPNGGDRSPKGYGGKRPSTSGAVKVGEAACEAGCLYREHGDGSADRGPAVARARVPDTPMVIARTSIFSKHFLDISAFAPHPHGRRAALNEV